MTFPAPWPYSTPDPGPGFPDQDETFRWGEGKPLPTKMAEYYPGKATGVMQAVAVGAAAVFLPRDGSAISATLQIQGGPIRWTVDGSTPTATTGFREDPGTVIRVTGPEDLLSFQMIAETATAATVVCQFAT